MKTKVLLNELQLNADLLRLRKIQPFTVSKYRQNYREGANFPAIVAEEGTGFIVSGNHRYTAMLEEFGEDHETDVIFKKFPSKKDLLQFFTKENVKHGLSLDGLSKRLITVELIKTGCSMEEISKLFNVPVKSIKQYADGQTSVTLGNGKIEQKPVKRGFEPDRPITQVEYDMHLKKDRGLPIGQKTNELVRWLNGDFIAHTEVNKERINELKNACEKWLAVAET